MTLQWWMKVTASQKGPSNTSHVQLEVREVYCKVDETACLFCQNWNEASSHQSYSPLKKLNDKVKEIVDMFLNKLP